MPVPSPGDAPRLEVVFGDAYGVQHHGDESPQAVQSVALHLLNPHGIVSGRTTRPGWAIERAIRVRGVFHRLEPPPLGSALTIRHLFPGGGVVAPVTRGQYVASVYDTWMSLHRSTLEGLVGLEGEARARELARYGDLRGMARRYRWYLEVQRESLGLHDHRYVDESYVIPGPLDT